MLPPLPPGPTSHRFLQTLQFGLRSYDFMSECEAQFGDTFTLDIVGIGPMVMFSDPSAVQDLFSVGSGEGAGMLGAILGPESLFELDGERHLQTRRLMLPCFRGRRMHRYGELMRELTDAAVETWPKNETFRIHEKLQSIALDVILRAVFGMDEASRMAELRRRLLRFLALFDSRLGSLVMLPALQIDLGRFSPWGRVRQHIREIDHLLFEEIARRRAEGDVDRQDVLSMLIFARDEQGKGLSDTELRDQMFTLLLAGHETTATAMSWVLYRVLQRPDVLTRIHQELENVSGPADLEPEQISQLEYLDAVIQETLRLHPVIPEVGRRLARSTRIGDVELPAGVMAAASIYLTHRRPDLWPLPERFEPERFRTLRPSPFEYFPFGGGVRRCMGAAFATYEMKMVLATLLSRVDLQLDPSYRARVVRRAIACTPSEGVPVRLRAA